MQDPGPRERNVAAGIGWMVVSGICFVAVTALVKQLGTSVPAAQSAFLRYLLGLVFLLPMLRSLLQTRISGRMHLTFWIRGLAHSAGVICWFYAMTQITIAEVTALNYLVPVLVTVGAALVLGERVAFRRILAVCAGLAGAIVILRPGLRELSLGHIAMFGTAASFAVSYLMAKRMTDRFSAATIVCMLSFTVTAGLTPFAIAVWVPPTIGQLAILFLVAAFATAGHYVMTIAFRKAPVSATQPVTFLQLVWSALIGLLIFGEGLDPYVLAGGLLIISATSFIAWRETVISSRNRRGS